MRFSVDRGDNGLLFALEFRLMYKDRHRVDSGWHMLEGDTVLLKCLEYFSAKSNLCIHHILINIDRYEPFLSGDTGDRILWLMAGALHDPGSCIIRCIRVADIDRDTGFPYREYGIFMKHSGAHIRKLTELAVCDRLDWLRIVDNPWIRDQETGYIRPVLIAGCMHSSCYDRTCDIRTSSGEGLNRSVLLRSIKARNDCSLYPCKTL